MVTGVLHAAVMTSEPRWLGPSVQGVIERDFHRGVLSKEGHRTSAIRQIRSCLVVSDVPIGERQAVT